MTLPQRVAPTNFSSILPIEEPVCSPADLYTFRKPELLRATKISKILHSGGHIFADKKGTQETYNLSKQTSHIDVFISHNWSVPRLSKFMVLAFYFNLKNAACGVLVLYVVITVFVVIGILPIFPYEATSYSLFTSINKKGHYCVILVLPTFLLIIFFLHEFPCISKRIRQTAFLDKTCINQVDDDQKRQGIACLAAFLANSEKLLIVYTSEYLKKLWTVYEMASFLLIEELEEKPVRIIPTFYPQFVLGWCCIYVLMGSGVAALQTTAIRDMFAQNLSHIKFLIHFAGVLSMLALLCWIREWRKIHLRLVEYLETFDFKKLNCFAEADRDIVEGNIEVFLKSRALVWKSATRDDALTVWNELLRQWIPLLWEEQFSVVGMPYLHIVVVALICSANKADGIGSMFCSETSADVVLVIIKVCVEIVTLLPNWIGICFWIMGQPFTCLASLNQRLSTVIVSMSSASLIGMFFMLDHVFTIWALSSLPGCLAYITYLGINGAVTWYLFSFRGKTALTKTNGLVSGDK